MKNFPIPKMFGAVTVGGRGQVVIPSGVRKLYRIKSGDKLFVFAKHAGGPIGLIPAEQFTQFLEQATKMLTKIKGESV
ncbi:MAG: AbrB/MazE/SpoVT family DNA-binding domain-containing protein [Candidatus Omnitrophica bacterium]|nr:AbrB/MazE/SpoVT family DNA-binding domain-containing protein [Candidatus Omnitrophota bacterium]